MDVTGKESLADAAASSTTLDTTFNLLKNLNYRYMVNSIFGILKFLSLLCGVFMYVKHQFVAQEHIHGYESITCAKMSPLMS